MFLLPVSTDAPVYHLPWGTVGLIAANTAVTLGISMGVLPPLEGLVPDYALAHGEGLHPLQWVTSNFLHAGWGHLLGNLVFLWVFGLVVEGKTGWKLFLPLALGIGVVECAIEQLCLPASPPSLGASSIVFGLMLVALVWAPRNDIEFAYGFWLPLSLHIDTFGISLLWLSALMVAKEVAVAAWLGFSIGRELFHLIGAALGLGAGLSLLRAGLVDCEGWDLPTLWFGKPDAAPVPIRGDARVIDGRSAELAALSETDEASRKQARRIRSLKRIHAQLEKGDAAAAMEELRKARQLMNDFQLGRHDLERLIEVVEREACWSDLADCYDELINRFEAKSSGLRLLLAELYLDRLARPAAALQQLTALPAEAYAGPQRARFEKLLSRAQTQVDAGVIELRGANWGSVDQRVGS
jgi:membrane associated rhomboid family serine protease